MIQKRKISGREIIGWLLVCLSTGMLGRSILLCFSNDIWYDELFTVGMIEHSYGELVRFTAADVHPPLYYCLVKLFVELCKLIAPGVGTVIPAKIMSVLPYFILLSYAVTFMRRRFSSFAGGLFLFCVTTMPQLSAYTVEVRMYGWALLFVTAAFCHAYGCLTTESAAAAGKDPAVGTENGEAAGRGRYLHGAALVLYGLAAAYTQYFAAVAVGMVYLYLLVMFLCRDRSRLREWLCYAAVSVLGYVPWLFALAGQISAVRENYWILPLSWRSLGGCVKFLMKPAFTDDRLNRILAVIMFAAFLGLWCLWVLKLYYNRREEKEINGNEEDDKSRERFVLATAAVGVLAGLVVFGFAASFLIRPIFVYRYMIPAAGCFWLGFAMGLDEILCQPQDWLKNKLCKLNSTLGLLLLLLVIAVGLRDYRAFMGEEEYKIRLMKETEAALSKIGPQDSVLYNFDQVQAVTGYYLPGTAERYLWRIEGEKLIQEITSPCGSVEDVEEIRKLLKAAQKKEGNLWFIGSFHSRDDIVAEWRDAGLEVEEMGSFLLERYWFNLYKIS